MDAQRNCLYEFGSFRIDTRERLLLREGNPVPLPPRVYDTLLVLVESTGHIIEKAELMKAVWPDTFVEESNLTVNISALRRALGEEASEHRYIETVPRRGYRFVPKVTRVNGTATDSVSGEAGPVDAVTWEQAGVKADKQESWEGDRTSRISGVSVAVPRRSTLFLPVVGLSVLIGLTAVAYYSWIRRPDRGFKIRSIAVLPFKPLATDSRDEPLEVGMCDALITRLGSINQLVVRPTSSVIAYNTPGQDPLAAGRELGVDALLDAYVQRSGDRIRVTARLLSVSDGKPLWSGQFNENFTDIFMVEDSISERMVDALRLNLTGDERRRVTMHYTDDTEAYQLYLKGRYFQNRRTPEGLIKSIEYFERATEKDAKYALAFAGLSDSYVVLAVRNDMRPQESFQKAKAAAMRALQFDDTIAEAHASLGNVRYWYDWDWTGAETEIKRAIDLSPNYPFAHSLYASYLIVVGRTEEAISEGRRAQALEPVSAALNTQLARVLYFARRYDDAIDQCQKTLELDHDFGTAHIMLGRCYCQKGMYEQALTELGRAKDLLRGAEALSLLGYTRAMSGSPIEAQKILQELERQSTQRYVSPYHTAMVYAGLGQQDKSLDLLEKTYLDRDGRMTVLKCAPEFDSLHSSPQFADLIRRLGLTPP